MKTTTELNIDELVTRIEEYGFLVLPSLAEKACYEEVARGLKKLMIERGENGTPSSHLRAVFNVLPKDGLAPFEKLLSNPVLVSLAERVLGSDFRMTEIGARWVQSDSAGLSMHVGAPVSGKRGSDSPSPSKCHVLTFSWLLSDMDTKSGRRFFMPFSHHYGHPPRPGIEYPYCTYIEAPIGSLIVFNSATWHGFDTPPGTDSEGRLELCSGYVVPWIDPEVVGWKLIGSEVLEHCSDFVRRRSKR
jgi:hypothetical protein